MRSAARLGLSALLLARVHGADVTFVQVNKTVAYVQTGTAAPGPQATPYIFRARVDLAQSNSVSAANVKWPLASGITRSLTNYGMFWEYSQSYPLSDSLNFSNPNGTYTVYLQGAVDGKKTNALTLSADGYPAIVHIANFADTQKVNPQNDFKLQWDPNATIASDIVRVQIFSGDQLLRDSGGVPGAAGTLNGTVTSYTIPKNTLASGKAYRVRVSAIRKSTSDTAGYAGVPAWASYGRFTEFTLRTVYPTLDVNWYGIAKIRRYSQGGASPPTPFASGGYAFSAFTIATDPLNLQSAALKLPNGSSKTLIATGANWTFADFTDTAQQLDNKYGAGAYQMNLQTTHNGSQQLLLTAVAAGYPSALQISNWADASTIDPGAPLTLKWLAIPGASADDFVQITLRRNNQIVFRTADSPAIPGALNGLNSAITIPAGLLEVGDTPEVTFLYIKSLSSDLLTYPQALGTIGAGSETHAILKTTGPTVLPASLGVPRFSNGNLELTLSCAAGRQQVIQTSSDFQQWNDWLLTNAPGNSFLIRIPVAQGIHLFGVRVKTN